MSRNNVTASSSLNLGSQLMMEGYAWIGIPAEFYTQNFNLTIPLAITYVICILALKRFMKHREKFGLRVPLFFWSLSLAIFSLFAFLGTLHELVQVWTNNGWHYSICEKWNMVSFRQICWSEMFQLSKIIEFGDTVFIVLRKGPLTFLHVFHHSTALILAFCSGTYEAPVTYQFGSINLFIHVLMYSYYALKAIRVFIPRSISRAITSLQLVQMVTCMVLVSYALVLHVDGNCRAMNYGSFVVAGSIYTAYSILFTNFFYVNYVKRPVSGAGKIKRK